MCKVCLCGGNDGYISPRPCQLEQECMAKYFFTFGSDMKYPFQNGWVEVIAESHDAACEKYKAKYPNRKNSDAVNCAFIYSAENFYSMPMYKSGNFGAFCKDLIQ